MKKTQRNIPPPRQSASTPDSENGFPALIEPISSPSEVLLETLSYASSVNVPVCELGVVPGDVPVGFVPVGVIVTPVNGDSVAI